MGLYRSQPLLTTSDEVCDITSIQDLAHLESDAEFSVADTLRRAHEWVYDRIRRRLPEGSLARITNEVELERAVAARFLEMVAPRVGEDRSYWSDQAEKEVDGFRPIYSDDGDSPRASSEGLPRVKNIMPGPLFGRFC